MMHSTFWEVFYSSTPTNDWQQSRHSDTPTFLNSTILTTSLSALARSTSRSTTIRSSQSENTATNSTLIFINARRSCAKRFCSLTTITITTMVQGAAVKVAKALLRWVSNNPSSSNSPTLLQRVTRKMAEALLNTAAPTTATVHKAMPASSSNSTSNNSSTWDDTYDKVKRKKVENDDGWRYYWGCCCSEARERYKNSDKPQAPSLR